MVTREQFAARMRLAFRRYEGDGERVEQAEFGRRVAKRLRRKPLTQATVSRWFRDAIPPLDVLAAIADELGVRRGWLAFGEGPMVPASASELSGAADATAGRPGHPPRG